MPDLKNLIVSLEKQGWEASKTQDPSFYLKYMAENCPVITPFGTFTREMILSEMENASQKVTDYEIIEPQVFILRDDFVVISYKAMTETSQTGILERKFSWVSTIYEKKGEKWLFTLNQHIPIAN